MATTTKSRSTRSRTSAKAKAAEPTPEVVTEEPTPTAEAKSTSSTYRELPDFTPALKAAKSLAKGNTDLSQSLQLITHLAWKTPGGSVGWSKGTTANVIAYADDIAVPTGTPIPAAMEATLAVAAKAAIDEPQKQAVAILSEVITAHA